MLKIETLIFFQKDEEWKEYEEFKKDYSGLKIDNLKIDADNLPIGDDEETELNEDGEKVKNGLAYMTRH